MVHKFINNEVNYIKCINKHPKQTNLNNPFINKINEFGNIADMSQLVIKSAINIYNDYISKSKSDNDDITIGLASLTLASKFFDADIMLTEDDIPILTDGDVSKTMLLSSMNKIMNICPNINKYYSI